MARTRRIVAGGSLYHVLNRKNTEGVLFDSPTCYRAFLHYLSEAAELTRMRILAYCLMPNHWHMLLWPRLDEDLCRFVHRLSLRHTASWHLRRGTRGRGHLYQSRYKSFEVVGEPHLLAVCAYVERNPVRGRLVERARDWPWSSVHRHIANPGDDLEQQFAPALEPMPIALPEDWERRLDEPEPPSELDQIRFCAQRGTSFPPKKGD